MTNHNTNDLREICINLNNSLMEISENFLEHYLHLFVVVKLLSKELNDRKSIFMKEIEEFKNHPEFEEVITYLKFLDDFKKYL